MAAVDGACFTIALGVLLNVLAVVTRPSSNNEDLFCVKPMGRTGNSEMLVTITVASVVVALEALRPWVSNKA